MKFNRINLVIILMIITGSVVAQPGGEKKSDRHEEMETMKIGFMTRKLDLTPEESQNFWPVYNGYSKEIESIRRTSRKEMGKLKNADEELTDAEIEAIVDKQFEYRQQEHDIRKRYHEEFKKVLPISKVARLYKAEEDFKRELLRMLKNKDRERSGRRPPGR